MSKLTGILLMGAAMTVAARAQASGPASQGLQVTSTAVAGYNSNLRGNNATPQAGAQYQLSSDFAYVRSSATETLSVHYEPYAQFFPVDSGLNSLNQIAGANGQWQVTPRWILSGQVDGGYMEMLPANTNTGLQPVLSQQTYAATPRTRESTGDGQLALAYQLSPRWQASVSGGYNQIEFPGSPAQDALSGVRQSQGGAGVDFRYSARTQLGLQLSTTNASLGTTSHLAADSALLTWHHALTPLTTVELEGGPEYSQVHDALSLALGIATLTANLYRVRTYPRASASVAHTGTGVSWNLQGDSRISSGIGAMPFPAQLLDARGTVTPRLPAGWRLQLGTQVSQLTALAGDQIAGRLRMATAGLELSRQLDRHLSLDLQYNRLAQRGSGALPLAPNLDQNLALAGLTWHWRALPLPELEGH